jgi:hypothetical protein
MNTVYLNVDSTLLLAASEWRRDIDSTILSAH